MSVLVCESGGGGGDHGKASFVCVCVCVCANCQLPRHRAQSVLASGSSLILLSANRSMQVKVKCMHTSLALGQAGLVALALAPVFD